MSFHKISKFTSMPSQVHHFKTLPALRSIPVFSVKCSDMNKNSAHTSIIFHIFQAVKADDRFSLLVCTEPLSFDMPFFYKLSKIFSMKHLHLLNIRWATRWPILFGDSHHWFSRYTLVTGRRGGMP